MRRPARISHIGSQLVNDHCALLPCPSFMHTQPRARCVPKVPTAAPKPGTTTLGAYAQCGGLSGGGTGPFGDFTYASKGGAACPSGYSCTRSNEWCASQHKPKNAVSVLWTKYRVSQGTYKPLHLACPALQPLLHITWQHGSVNCLA